METIVIVTLGVMLIIALVKLRSKEFDNEVLTNRLKSEVSLKEYNNSESKRRESKLSRLQDKYDTALAAINEKKEVIRLRDLKIIDLEKTNKEYSARVYQLQTVRDTEKDAAIKLCKKSVAAVAHLRAELDSIEVLLSKYTPQPLLLP